MLSFNPLSPPVRQPATLPGVASTAPYEYYSGYLNAGVPPSGHGLMFFHYICAMAPAWQSKPLSIWYNGGPGAPSTFGLFQEFGPYLLTSESLTTAEYKQTKIPTPLFNPRTWANLTSLCEIDSPAPMGASYCTEGNGSASSHGGPAGDAYTCGPWSDKSTAKANHHAHLSFFRDAFPEFEASQQPVSLVGESYAGVYVPLFANEWLDDPIKGPKGKLINFKGIAVGDGFPACIPQPGKPIDWCVNLVEVEFFRYPNALPGPYWDVEFFHGHSQMSEDLYQRIVTEGGCSDDELRGKQAPLAPGAKCLALLSEMSAEVGFFYAYNLFEACPDEVPNKTSTVAAASTEPGLPKSSRRMTSGSVRPRSLTTPRHGTGATAAVAISTAGDATSTAAASTTAAAPPPLYSIVPSPGDGDTGLGAPCLGSAMKTYFGLPTVTQALGIPDNNRFIVLDNGIGMNYTTDSAFVGYVYEKLVKAGKTVLVYEGDSDDCGLQTAPVEDIWVPFFGNGTRRPDQWTPAGPLNTPTSMPLRLPLTHPWRPFGVLPAGRKVQGGFSMSWNHGQVTFVSVRGAGHLLPLYRPAASYTMMHSYQTGEALPPTFWP